MSKVCTLCLIVVFSCCIFFTGCNGKVKTDENLYTDSITIDDKEINVEINTDEDTKVNSAILPTQIIEENLQAEPTQPAEESLLEESVQPIEDDFEEEYYYNDGLVVTPWIDSDLKENITEGIELSPKEDFHLYVNYEWLKEAELPSGRSSWSSFDEAAMQSLEKVIELIRDESIKGHDIKLVRDLYNAILNWDERNKIGIEPLKQIIEEIEAVGTLDELTDLICDSEKINILPRFVKINVGPGILDSSRNTVSVNIMTHNSPIGQVDRFTDQQIALEKIFFSNMMERMGYTQTEADQIYDGAMNRVEKNFYWNPYGQVTYEDKEAYSKNTVIKTNAEMRELTRAYPLMQIMDVLGFGEAEQYEVSYPEVIKNLDNVYTEKNLINLKRYMIVNCVMSLASILDNETYRLIEDYIKAMYGTEDSYSEEIRALNSVESCLSEPLSRVYLQKYDLSEIKERITNLVHQIIDEYRIMLNEEEWISEQTKKYAIEKLDSMKIFAVYPEKIDDFSQLDLEGLSYYDIMLKLVDFNRLRLISKIGKPVDEHEWAYNVFEANAAYSVLNNSIYIPLGIMNGIFYYDGISDEELYACMGLVIGHEISHAFDTKGAPYDKNGDYSNWWTKEDYEFFQKRANKLIRYYDKMTAWPYTGNINGNLICNEAMADMAGMKVILRLAKQQEDFDYEKFFVSYAKVWRSISTNEFESYILMMGVHPLDYLRTNTVLQQFDEFLGTFDIKEGDTMYLAPKDRVSVW